MRLAFFSSVLVASTLVARVDMRAQDAADALRADDVVARIGAMRTIPAAELERRIAAMPPFQRLTFGQTADTIRRRMLLEVLVPEALLELGGEAQKLETEERVAYDLERARSSAALRALRERIGPAASVSIEDVRKYYDENRTRYDTPERYQLWRVLCETRETALLVLELAKKDPSPKNFGELAREHSLDKATRLRDGNLGFLTADGSSNEPGLRVDPAVVLAAQRVHDGEFVPVPVAEGAYFAVVWRRGTIPANKHPVEAVAAQIRDAIWKARLKQKTDELLAALRAARLRDVDEKLLDAVDLPAERPAVSPETLRDKRK